MATQPRPADPLQGQIDFWTERLFENGFVVIPDIADPAFMAELDADLSEPFEKTPFSQGNFYGTRTRRFGRALVRSPRSAALVQHELILGVAERALGPWCDSIQLNLTQAIAVHPGAPAQLPHRDEDMWPGPKGELEYMVNVIWPLTRFTQENGATRLWRYSNRRDKNAYIDDRDAVFAEMEVGSALVFLGSTLHGQGANRTEEIRRALVVGYSLSWIKQFENQYLSYPREVARTFSKDLAGLVGYAPLPSNMNSYEGRSPMTLLEDEVPEHLGAVDLFRPDQVEAIDHYHSVGSPRII